METLRHVVVLVHIVGFAVTFGGWVTLAAARRRDFVRPLEYGLLISLVSGAALAFPWPAGTEVNYTKVGIKLAILVVLGAVLGMGRARQRRTGGAVSTAMFGAVGVLTLTAAGLGVVWR
ncbi:Fe-S protein [uncultured Williamsia sp.]|uniref:Fe-S protein n=1 Tax=uncultured Williamsia sp. TaxID=259311 RepID=UPI002634F8C3|nr:Fe-S protein [uncultured Williamsia sp.]